MRRNRGSAIIRDYLDDDDDDDSNNTASDSYDFQPLSGNSPGRNTRARSSSPTETQMAQRGSNKGRITSTKKKSSLSSTATKTPPPSSRNNNKDNTTIKEKEHGPFSPFSPLLNRKRRRSEGKHHIEWKDQVMQDLSLSVCRKVSVVITVEEENENNKKTSNHGNGSIDSISTDSNNDDDNNQVCLFRMVNLNSSKSSSFNHSNLTGTTKGKGGMNDDDYNDTSLVNSRDLIVVNPTAFGKYIPISVTMDTARLVAHYSSTEDWARVYKFHQVVWPDQRTESLHQLSQAIVNDLLAPGSIANRIVVGMSPSFTHTQHLFGTVGHQSVAKVFSQSSDTLISPTEIMNQYGMVGLTVSGILEMYGSNKYYCRVSVLEVADDDKLLYDLLALKPFADKDAVKLINSRGGSSGSATIITGLSESTPITSVKQVGHLLRRAFAAALHKNRRSPRGHIVLTISVTLKSNNNSNSKNNHHRTTCAQFIDLAPIQYDDRASYARRNASIRKTTWALGGVLRGILLKEAGNETTIPYRETMLTKVLQRSIQQTDSRVVLLANVTSKISQYDNTMSTLRYASRLLYKPGQPVQSPFSATKASSSTTTTTFTDSKYENENKDDTAGTVPFHLSSFPSGQEGRLLKEVLSDPRQRLAKVLNKSPQKRDAIKTGSMLDPYRPTQYSGPSEDDIKEHGGKKSSSNNNSLDYTVKQRNNNNNSKIQTVSTTMKQQPYVDTTLPTPLAGNTSSSKKKNILEDYYNDDDDDQTDEYYESTNYDLPPEISPLTADTNNNNVFRPQQQQQEPVSSHNNNSAEKKETTSTPTTTYFEEKWNLDDASYGDESKRSWKDNSNNNKETLDDIINTEELDDIIPNNNNNDYPHDDDELKEQRQPFESEDYLQNNINEDDPFDTEDYLHNNINEEDLFDTDDHLHVSNEDLENISDVDENDEILNNTDSFEEKLEQLEKDLENETRDYEARFASDKMAHRNNVKHDSGRYSNSMGKQNSEKVSHFPDKINSLERILRETSSESGSPMPDNEDQHNISRKEKSIENLLEEEHNDWEDNDLVVNDWFKFNTKTSTVLSQPSDEGQNLNSNYNFDSATNEILNTIGKKNRGEYVSKTGLSEKDKTGHSRSPEDPEARYHDSNKVLAKSDLHQRRPVSVKEYFPRDKRFDETALNNAKNVLNTFQEKEPIGDESIDEEIGFSKTMLPGDQDARIQSMNSSFKENGNTLMDKIESPGIIGSKKPARPRESRIPVSTKKRSAGLHKNDTKKPLVFNNDSLIESGNKSDYNHKSSSDDARKKHLVETKDILSNQNIAFNATESDYDSSRNVDGYNTIDADDLKPVPSVPSSPYRKYSDQDDHERLGIVYDLPPESPSADKRADVVIEVKGGNGRKFGTNRTVEGPGRSHIDENHKTKEVVKQGKFVTSFPSTELEGKHFDLGDGKESNFSISKEPLSKIPPSGSYGREESKAFISTRTFKGPENSFGIGEDNAISQNDLESSVLDTTRTGNGPEAYDVEMGKRVSPIKENGNKQRTLTTMTTASSDSDSYQSDKFPKNRETSMQLSQSPGRQANRLPHESTYLSKREKEAGASKQPQYDAEDDRSSSRQAGTMPYEATYLSEREREVDTIKRPQYDFEDNKSLGRQAGTMPYETTYLSEREKEIETNRRPQYDVEDNESPGRQAGEIPQGATYLSEREKEIDANKQLGHDFEDNQLDTSLSSRVSSSSKRSTPRTTQQSSRLAEKDDGFGEIDELQAAVDKVRQTNISVWLSSLASIENLRNFQISQIDKMSNLEDERDRARADVARLNAELQDTIESFRTEIREKNEEIDMYQGKIEKIKKERSEVVKIAEDSISTQAKLEEKCNDLERQLSLLIMSTVSKESFDELTERNKMLEDELRILKEKIMSCEEELQGRNAIILKLEKSLDEMQAEISNLVIVRNKHEKTIKSLESSLAEARDAEVDADDLRRKLSELQNELDLANLLRTKTDEEYLDTIASKDEFIKELEQIVEDGKAELSDLQHRSRSESVVLRNEILQLEEAVAKSNSAIDSRSDQLRKAEQRLQELLDGRNRLSDELEHTREELNLRIADVHNLTSNLKEVWAEKEKEQSKMNGMQNELAAFQNETRQRVEKVVRHRDEAASLLEKTVNENKALLETNDKLQAAVENLREQLETSEKTSEDARADIMRKLENLSKENRTLISENNGLRVELGQYRQHQNNHRHLSGTDSHQFGDSSVRSGLSNNGHVGYISAGSRLSQPYHSKDYGHRTYERLESGRAPFQVSRTDLHPAEEVAAYVALSAKSKMDRNGADSSVLREKLYAIEDSKDLEINELKSRIKLLERRIK